MVDIDKSDHKQHGNQDEIDQCGQAETELHPAGHGKQAAEQLDDRVSDGYPGAATAAAPAQDEVADQRDVIVPADSGAACRAGRSRADDGFSSGQAIDTDIQETADTHTDKKNIPINHCC